MKTGASILLIGSAVGVFACGDDAATPMDAAPDASPYCADPPSNPATPGTYKLYLNTEGVTLITGSDDARTNTTMLVPSSNTVIPVFLPGVATRDTVIADIVAQARSRLDPYSIDLVTARPASGDYDMIVLGGSSLGAGLAANITATTPFDCTSTYRDHLALMFDTGTVDTTTADYANRLLGSFGNMVGLTYVKTPDDCECVLDDECQASTGALCTFGTSPTTTVLTNCGRSVQDGRAFLRTALGCR